MSDFFPTEQSGPDLEVSSSELHASVPGKTDPGSPGSSSSGHFATDHLLQNLPTRAISSGIVTATAQGFKFVVNLISAIVLSRLLDPHDFGLVAMVTTVTGFLIMFKEAGLSVATVQREKITHQQVSNLFWINVALSVVMFITAFCLAPVLAWFYHEPRLTGITVALSFSFLFTGSIVQHLAILTRQMRFKTLAIIEVASLCVSVLVGCIMALRGFGYWSLAGVQLALALSSFLFTWVGSGWRPGWPKRNAGTAGLLKFGLDMTASNFVYRLARGCDTILLGRFWGAASVGLYNRATVLLVRPLDQFLAPVGAVLVPVLSRLQAQPERYRRVFLRVYEAIGLVTFPATAMFLALSHPLILLLLGSKWEQASVLFAGFTLAALYMPLAIAATWLFTSQGRSRDMLRMNLILSSLTLLAFIGGLPYGPLGLVLAFSISGLAIRLPILYFMVGRRGPVRTSDLWAVLLHGLPLWAGVYLSTSAVRIALPHSNSMTQLLACIPVGLATNLAIICLLKRQRETACYLLDAIRRMLPAKLSALLFAARAFN